MWPREQWICPVCCTSVSPSRSGSCPVTSVRKLNAISTPINENASSTKEVVADEHTAQAAHEERGEVSSGGGTGDRGAGDLGSAASLSQRDPRRVGAGAFSMPRLMARSGHWSSPRLLPASVRDRPLLLVMPAQCLPGCNQRSFAGATARHVCALLPPSHSLPSGAVRAENYVHACQAACRYS
jgi:hypothetical protein